MTACSTKRCAGSSSGKPDSDVVDHSRMPDLVLREGEFRRMTDEIRAKFGKRAYFDVSDLEDLDRKSERMVTDSYQ